MPKKIADLAESQPSRDGLRDWLPYVLTAAVAFLLLYLLGDAALFEPDEGRNAEKAREILLLNDWVTPHENFHPVLDTIGEAPKPVAKIDEYVLVSNR